MGQGTDIPNILKFDVTVLNVTEPAPSLQPSTIIPRNSAFTLSADFYIDRWLGTGLNNQKDQQNKPVNEYNVTYYAESIGPGPEYKFPLGPASVTQVVTCIPGQYSYGAALTSYTVPANTMDEGTYRLTCVVKMSPVGGGSTGFPLHVIGFVEGPMIDIYIP
jgi:hypothetical protein